MSKRWAAKPTLDVVFRGNVAQLRVLAPAAVAQGAAQAAVLSVSVRELNHELVKQEGYLLVILEARLHRSL